MAQHQLTLFSNAPFLRSISRPALMRLLEPFRDALQEYGLDLSWTDMDPSFYDDLAEVLACPPSYLPDDLAAMFAAIDEMASPGAMDMLLKAIPGLQPCWDATPADVAVESFLDYRETFEQKHAERLVKRRRTFESFYSELSGNNDSGDPLNQRLRSEMEERLDAEFQAAGRGTGTRLRVAVHPDGVWFLIRHGDRVRREAVLDDGTPASVFFRPEKCDVVIYCPETEELRISTCHQWQKHLYRRVFGAHLFGDEQYFPGTAKYTLEPLRRDGGAALVCCDIPGLRSVRLRSIEFLLRGAESIIMSFRGANVLAALTERNECIPDEATIREARFEMKFEGAPSPRVVVIRGTNVAQYTRDSDSLCVEDWLYRRGFILDGADRHGDKAHTLLENTRVDSPHAHGRRRVAPVHRQRVLPGFPISETN